MAKHFRSFCLALAVSPLFVAHIEQLSIGNNCAASYLAEIFVWFFKSFKNVFVEKQCFQNISRGQDLVCRTREKLKDEMKQQEEMETKCINQTQS